MSAKRMSRVLQRAEHSRTYRLLVGAVFTGGLSAIATVHPALGQCEAIQIAKLVASDAGAGDVFGAGVATHGKVVIVGALKDECSGGGSDCGSAYVYRFNGTTWIEEQVLAASDAIANGGFGYSVSVSENVAIIGSPRAACASGRCGAAYVYRFDGSSWIEEQKLVASDAHDGANFGFGVAGDGNVALIGAFEDDISDGDTDGAAYVYRFDGITWVEEQILTPSDAPSFCGEGFGGRVSLDGAVAVVGASYDSCEAEFRNGAAYVYRFNGTSWVEEQRLTASDAASDENLGHGVAVSGDVVVLGAFKADTPGGANTGASYVFRYDGNNWQQEKKLVASDASSNDWYGHSVGIHGDHVFVGSYQDDCAVGDNCGAAYSYQYDGSAWAFEQIIVASDAQAGDQLGSTVAIGNRFAVANAGSVDCAAGANCGAAYVFSVTCNPTCDPGGPYDRECGGDWTSILLDGTASSDPDGDALGYWWETDCPGGWFDDAGSAAPVLSVDTSGGCGVNCNVTLTVDDGNGGTAECSAAVEIADTEPPVVSCSVRPVQGHRLMIEYSAEDACGEVTGAAVIETLCCPLPVVDGQVVKVECEDEEECELKLDFEDGVFEIKTNMAALVVTAMDECGNEATCTVDLCVSGDDHGDSDGDHHLGIDDDED